MDFHEHRDPYLVPSSLFPSIPFLLNAPLMLNQTFADGKLGNPRYVSPIYSVPGAGDSQEDTATRRSFRTTEDLLGPVGQIMIPGFSTLGTDVYHFPGSRTDQTWQLADTVNFNEGRHLWTAGFDLRWLHLKSFADRNARPLLEFSGVVNTLPGMNYDPTLSYLSDVTRGDGSSIDARPLSALTMAAAGIPMGIFQTLEQGPETDLVLNRRQLDLFVNHDRRISNSLDVSLGLRASFIGSLNDETGRIRASFDQALLHSLIVQAAPGDSVFQQTVEARFPNTFDQTYGQDARSFDLRTGFAFNPAGSTLIRGGWGIYNGIFPAILVSEARSTFPQHMPLNFASNINGAFSDILPNPANPKADLGLIKPGTLNQFFDPNPVTTLLHATGLVFPELQLVQPDSGPKNPYSIQQSLTVEQSIGSFRTRLGYVGTMGKRLLRVTTIGGLLQPVVTSYDLNPPSGAAPYSQPTYFVGVGSSPAALREPIYYGDSYFTVSHLIYQSSSVSSFHSLQAELRKDVTHGIGFASGFTYAHAIDDASDFFDLAGAYALPQRATAPSERGNSNYDVRLRSTSQFFIEPASWSRTLHGFHLAGTYTAQTGQPFTVNSSIDVNRDGNLTDRLNTTQGVIYPSGDPSHILSLQTSTNPFNLLARDFSNGQVGRNTFRGRGISTLDLALSKDLAIHDERKAVIRVEAFNLLNSANVGLPQRILESPGFGRSFYTTVPARTLQVALKMAF
jgi:hypothetical protein